MTDPAPTADPAAGPTPKRGRAGPLVRGLLAAAALAAAFVAGGLVFTGPLAVAQEMMANGAGMGGHGAMHAMARAHLERMLTEVDATADQRARIEAIFKTLHGQMTPLHARFADSHKELARLLTAPAIDRAAIEQVRAARMADLDQASKGMIGAIADAAEVLTPAQRAKLATVMAQRQHPKM